MLQVATNLELIDRMGTTHILASEVEARVIGEDPRELLIDTSGLPEGFDPGEVTEIKATGTHGPAADEELVADVTFAGVENRGGHSVSPYTFRLDNVRAGPRGAPA